MYSNFEYDNLICPSGFCEAPSRSLRKQETEASLSSMKVGTDITEAFQLPGSPTSDNGKRPSTADRKASVANAHLTPEEAFVEDLRNIIKAPTGDCLHYACNFSDSDALLRFMVRLSRNIIERRKTDPICTTT